MKVVFDTNVLLSASFTPGVCEVLLDLCLTADDLTVIVSRHILDEFAAHAADKFRVPAVKIEAVLAQLRARCVVVEPVAIPREDFGDVDDLPVRGTAIAAGADALVTGDAELLGLAAYRGVAILSPRALYQRLRK